MLSQLEIKATIVPLLKENGQTYKKHQNILAKAARKGQQISTITNDGLETVNQAEAGDYIVKNLTEAGERYLVSEENFEKRYRWIGEARSGYSLYESMGTIRAIQLDADLLQDLEQPECFHFEAAWGEAMVAKTGDFLVSPEDYSEVYRIAEKEFFETYRPM